MRKTEIITTVRQLEHAGHYFELISTSQPVNIIIVGENERELARWDNESRSGVVHDRRGLDGFVRIDIEPTVLPTTISWEITDGLSTSRSVSADISDRVGRLLGIVYGSLGQLGQTLIGAFNTLWVTDRGYSYGASFSSDTGIAGNTNEAAVAPATNVNGITVWESEIYAVNGTGSCLTKLIAKTSAPASGVDGDVLLQAGSNLATAVGTIGANKISSRSVFVLPGKGLYFRNCVGTADAGSRKINITVH